MKLGRYSDGRLRNSMNNWGVTGDFEEPLYNYLVHGFFPGGFFAGVLANDFVSAMSRCHAGNHIESIKGLCGWLVNCCPDSAWGDYQTVNRWTESSSDERRDILLKHNLIYSEQDEIILILKDADENIETLIS